MKQLGKAHINLFVSSITDTFNSHGLVSNVALLFLLAIIVHLHPVNFRLDAVTVDGCNDEQYDVHGDL